QPGQAFENHGASFGQLNRQIERAHRPEDARRTPASRAALAWAGETAKASDYGPARRAETGADAAEKSGSVANRPQRQATIPAFSSRRQTQRRLGCFVSMASAWPADPAFDLTVGVI